MKYVFDGRFFIRELGGQERFSYEILSELDKISKKNEFGLIVPPQAENLPNYENIKIIKYGHIKNGFLWEQIDFLHYLIRYKKRGVYLCNTWPLFHLDCVTIHDVAMLANKQSYSNMYGKLSVAMHAVMFWRAARKSAIILTVSHFSKKEILKILKPQTKRIVVLGCGWQHFNRIEMDDSIFNRYPQLKKYEYYLSASSITPQKNFQWVKEAAYCNPGLIFAIAGKKVGLTVKESMDNTPPNFVLLGRVSDCELKSLMKYCKAFIHPAKYEGFGITPMEAMSVGAKVILANSSCLPEIYGQSAHYVDPNDPKVDLESILSEPLSEEIDILLKYSWENSARELYSALGEL